MCIDIVLQKASPHAAAKNGYTPLHITAKKNQLDIASGLLTFGAKTDAESKVTKPCFKNNNNTLNYDTYDFMLPFYLNNPILSL